MAVGAMTPAPSEMEPPVALTPLEPFPPSVSAAFGSPVRGCPKSKGFPYAFKFVSLGRLWRYKVTTYGNVTHHLLQKMVHLRGAGLVCTIGRVIGELHKVDSTQIADDELDLQEPSYIVALPQGYHLLI